MVLAALGLVQCILMLSIVHVSLGLHANFFQVLLTLWIASVVGAGVGLCISSVMRSNEQAIASLPLALLPMIVLGGCLTTVAIMAEHQPLGWLAEIAPTRWAYEANFVLESDAQGSSARFRKSEKPSKEKIEAMADQLQTLQGQLKDATAATGGLPRKDTRRNGSRECAAIRSGELPPVAASGCCNLAAICGQDFTGRTASLPVASRRKAGAEPPSSMPQKAAGADDASADSNNTAASSVDVNGYEDIAEQQFSADDKHRNSIPRHTWPQALARLGVMAVFWAMVTLAMLKKDEWEWWRNLATQLKRK